MILNTSPCLRLSPERIAALPWLGVALFLSLIAWYCPLSTTVEVEVLGDHLRWEVAGTEVSLPFSPGEIHRLRLSAPEGMAQIGWGEIRIREAGREAVLPAFSELWWKAPRRPPVGDWWVDEVLPRRVLGSYDLNIPSTFLLRARFRGRFLEEMRLEFEADHPFTLSFRRGWINNDLFIRDGEDRVLATSSIDPRPVDDLRALVGIAFRALAAACFVIFFVVLISPRRRRGALPNSRENRTGQGGAIHPQRRHLSLRRTLFFIGLAVLSILAVIQSLQTAGNLLDGLPHTPDEVVNLLQARWILQGRLTGDLPACPELEKMPLCAIRDGRRVGHYPPAWPLILSSGLALGYPALTPALFHGMLILLLGLIGRRMGGEWMGLIAALFGLASPLAALLYSSGLSHSGCATLLALALLLILRDRERTEESPSARRMVFAGAGLALAFGIRPLTALAAAVPMSIYLLFPGKNRIERSTLKPLSAGALPVLIPILWANALLSGAWWRFPYALAGAPMLSTSYLFEGLRNIDTLLASLPPLLNGWFWPLLPTGLGLPLGMALIPFLLRRSSPEDRLLLGIAGLILFSLLPVRATGLHGYGPRYLFAACIPLWLLQARSLTLLAEGESARRRLSAVLVALALGLSSLLLLPGRLNLYRNYNDVDGRLRRRLASLPKNSLVLVEPDNWRVWAEVSPWLGLRDQTSPALAREVLPLDEICVCRPDCRLFRWRDSEMVELGVCEAGQFCGE